MIGTWHLSSRWRGAQAALWLSAAALAAGCGGDGLPTGTPATGTPVRVAAVVQSSLQSSLRTVGTLAPAEQIRLSFKTAGVIASINVEQGERVQGGQLLASLAQQEVAAAVAQARALAEKAERDLERGRALFADEVATREQLDDLMTARDVAEANLRAAEFNARFARIEAPADGIVLRKLAEADELVAAGQPVLVVGDTSGGWIISAALADRDIVRVRVGDAARVRLDAYPGQVFPATVSELASAADPMTGTYEMKLSISPDGTRFVQGLVAKVEMTGAAGSNVSVVPVQALLEADGSEAVVYVVARRDNGEVAQRVAVRIGRLVGDQVEVLGGLAGDERVVTEGASYLRDGQAVRVLGAG
jgi:multidrug efflux system membrane fusion protein